MHDNDPCLLQKPIMYFCDRNSYLSYLTVMYNHITALHQSLSLGLTAISLSQSFKIILLTFLPPFPSFLPFLPPFSSSLLPFSSLRSGTRCPGAAPSDRTRPPHRGVAGCVNQTPHRTHMLSVQRNAHSSLGGVSARNGDALPSAFQRHRTYVPTTPSLVLSCWLIHTASHRFVRSSVTLHCIALHRVAL